MRVVNLLPKSERRVLYKERIFGAIKKFVFISVVTYILVFLIIVLAGVYDKLLLESIDSQIQQEDSVLRKQANAELKTKIDGYNNISLDYNNISASNPRWTKALREFAALVPSDIVITSFNANTKAGKIDIAGYSKSRESILSLREKIEHSPQFKNIDFPLENLQKPGNLNFKYTFYVEEGALKP